MAQKYTLNRKFELEIHIRMTKSDPKSSYHFRYTESALDIGRFAGYSYNHVTETGLVVEPRENKDLNGFELKEN